MHELTLTLSLLDEIEIVVRRERATSVTALHIRVSKQSAIACGALSYTWDAARAETIASGADVRIERVEGSAFDLVGLDLT